MYSGQGENVEYVLIKESTLKFSKVENARFDVSQVKKQREKHFPLYTTGSKGERPGYYLSS